MKKYIIILATAGLAFFACQKNEIELLDKPIVTELDGNKVSYTFTAVISDNVSELEEDGTKATVSRDGNFTWVEGDQLKFFKSDGTSADATVTAVDGLVASITVTTTADRSDFVSAIYPASAAIADQPYKVSFNARGPIVVSAVNGGTLAFYHIGSLVNLKFTDIPAGTASLVFTPESEFDYDGTFSFSERIPSLTKTGTTTKIVVPASTADEDNDITISVPSENLTGGFSAALNNNSAGTGRNLFKKSTAKILDLKTNRPVLLNMKKVACVADVYYLKVVEKTSGTSFWTSNTVLYPFIKTGDNTYSVTVNADRFSTYYVSDDWNGNILSGDLTSDVYTSNTFSMIGDGDALGNWSTGDNTSYALNKIGNWNYLFNKNTYGKRWVFRPWNNTSWTIWRPDNEGNDSWFTSSVKEISAHSAGGDAAFYTDLNESLDYYLNTETAKARVYSSGDKGNPLCALAEITFNESTQTITSIDVSTQAVSNAPFGDASFPTEELVLSGTFNSWGEAAMTYIGNQSWILENLVISTTNTYEFKFRKSGGWDYQIAAKDVIGAKLYGILRTQDDGSGYTKNASVNLSAGSYNVYLNATDGWFFNIMFVKQ